jgi:hypothetical protein
LDEILKAKIEHEISRIDTSLSVVKPLLDVCKIREPDIIELTAAAQVLHSFYTGVESIVVLFFKHKNEKLPHDPSWHKTLFEMASGLNSKNIIILRKDTVEQIQKYMYFRHFIRHSYSSDLDWGKMGPLINELESTWQTIKTDFDTFIKTN